MSEELMQVVPVRVGRFDYYPIRDTNLSQLRKAKIITAVTEKHLAKKKPDGLILVPKGAVKAVIEYKQTKNLKTDKQIQKAIQQEIEVAHSLCKVLIVTDNSKTFWINPLNGERICDVNGDPITQIVNVKKFQDGTMSSEEISAFEEILDRIEASISKTENRIAAPVLLDPSPLAKSLWQRIWISTGKEPEKCLYNVVELFVFKFLSDLGVLKQHNNFSAIYQLSLVSAEDALSQYAAVSRKEIRNLFPAGPDGTTIINGTIFVNEKGEANLAQASLFGDVLNLLEKFGRSYGSFRHIQRDFKTRLYEAFLRQSAGVKALGQYFTPRNVVRAMVRMSNAASLGKDARICDPYCGVGGFVLETIAEVPSIYHQFEPRNGKVSPSVSILGFDKGSDEKDDERTIILAKANMLIYFSDLIAKHHSPDILKEFSKNAFNKVFRLLRSNLGTFELVDEPKCSLILTNPPYVTTGVSTIRKALDDANLGDHYTIAGRGTEALAIEWIVRNLEHGGQALVIVPDGLLSQKPVLDFVGEHCNVQAIISLPPRTFYSTPKKTYILILTRKLRHEGAQTTPVFAYVIGEIGETRDAYRFTIPQNDLDEAVGLFNQFKGSPATFSSNRPRCKTVAATELLSARNWLIDRLWSDDERRALGIKEATTEVSADEFISMVYEAKDAISKLETITPTPSKRSGKVSTVTLGGAWLEFISSKTGWTKAQYRKLDTGNPKDVPLFTAAKAPVAFVKGKHAGLISASQDKPVISFGANGDGSAGTNFVFHTSPFYVSNDRTCIRVTDPEIDPEFVYFTLHGMKETYGFNHAFKASVKNLEMVTIDIPVARGHFDVERQRKMVETFKKIFETKRQLESHLESISKTRVCFG
ncbi:MAG TPA: N-6 DNA methylase [Sideroxyarcus sp.]|nr:N-6 DNA methylase [Sideroxyarcus sp.]